MTSIVGILCRDGVVLGSDSSATFGDARIRTIEQPTKKITVLGKCLILAGTGAVGYGQRFEQQIRLALGDFPGVNPGQDFTGVHPIDTGKALSKRLIQDLTDTGAQKNQYAALVAFGHKGTPQLCEFGLADLQPKLKTKHLWYASLGSAQYITDSHLALMRRVFWREGPPTLIDGVFAATWTLHHAIDANVGGVGGPIQLAVLRPEPGKTDKDGRPKLVAEELPDEQVDEHEQAVRDAEDHLREFAGKLQGAGAPDLPSPPGSGPAEPAS